MQQPEPERQGLGLLSYNLSGELSCQPVFQAANETADLLLVLLLALQNQYSANLD